MTENMSENYGVFCEKKRKSGSWLRSTVGSMPVFGRRTDPVLRSACSRRVTTMWVNRPLQVSRLPTQPFILSGSINSKLQLDLVAPSGECLQGEGLVWLIGALVCSLAAVAGPIVR